MRVNAVARARRGPRLASARSDIDVGIIVLLECNTIRFVGVVVGGVNFVGGGVNFVSGRGRGSTSPSVEGVEATSDLREGSFCQMTVGTTECVDPLVEGLERNPHFVIQGGRRVVEGGTDHRLRSLGGKGD
jgi:hypothetical protein